jgi:iron complex outermembrane receptor protein
MAIKHLQSSILAGTAIALTWSAMPAMAQVETVVVTAERRSEDLQKAPVAATVMTADDLRAHDVKGVDDLEFSTPSLTVGSNGQSTQINIRGIGKEDNSGTATSAVAVYRDGIGTISGFATNEPYYDIGTVEVLRGPQGTFSGENAAGGAIFINTKDPDPQGGYTGYAEVGYGNYNEKTAQGAINLPLSDEFAVRLAFDHLDRNSFYHVWMDPAMTIPNPNHVGARDYNSFRIGALLRPSENFEAKIKFDYNDLDNHGYAFGVVPGWPSPGSDDFLNCPCAANLSSDPFVIGNNATDNYAKDRNARGALDMTYTFGNGIKLRSLSGAQWLNTYIRNDDDGSAFVDRRQHINATFKIYSQEVTLVSPDSDTFSWILGGYFKKETLDFPPNDGFYLYDFTHYNAAGAPIFGVPPAPGPAAPQTEIRLVWHTPRTTKAVFGQASYNLTDDLKIDLGVRYQSYINSEVSDLSLPIFSFALPTATQRYSEDVVTGKVALNWQLNEQNFLYAFAASGSTTGGVSVVFGNPNFTNQYTWDYEAGWKGQLFDNQLFTQIGGFYDEIDNYQAYFVDGTTGLGTFQNLGGISKLYGVEAQAQAQFGSFGADVGVTAMNSELGSGLLLKACQAPLPPPAPPPPYTADTKGNRQPYTPNFTFHGGVQYAFQLGDEQTLTPRVDYAYTGDQTMDPLDDVNCLGQHISRTPSHGLLNAKITYAMDNWDIEAYMTNVTDEFYYEAHGGPGYNAYPNEPRRFGIRLHYNFDAGSR